MLGFRALGEVTTFVVLGFWGLGLRVPGLQGFGSEVRKLKDSTHPNPQTTWFMGSYRVTIVITYI